jgi:hypothetical protein
MAIARRDLDGFLAGEYGLMTKRCAVRHSESRL